MSGDDAKHVLTAEQRVTRVRETRVWTFLKNPEFRAKRDGNKAFARFDTSKAEAYSLMIKNGWQALVIVDQSGRYIGVLSKSVLIDSIFSELIGINLEK